MKNLKLMPYDISLIAGFIFCCVTVLWLAYSVSDFQLPKSTQPLTSTAWVINGETLYCTYEMKVWSAKNGMCYTSDMPK